MHTLYIFARVLPFIVSFRRDVRRWIFFGAPLQRTPAFHERRARRLVSTIAALGPSFVKIGQIFAGRADLLPEPYLGAVSTLTDKVPPVPVQEIERVIHEAYGRPVREVFQDWNPVPIASASLGQVHRARYLDVDVVVKVLRPGIERTVAADVAASSRILELAERFFHNPHLQGLRTILGEFAVRIGDEMDFRKEAAYAEEIRANFAYNSNVDVPVVFDEMTRQRVLVLEYMPGTRIDDLGPLIAAGRLDPQELVRKVMQLYVQMMLVDGLFHADPHPGNLLWGDSGRIVLLDFGLVVRVPQETRRSLVRTVFAAIRRDAAGVVDGFFALGLVPPGVQRDVIERLVATLLRIAHARTTTQERIELVNSELLTNEVLETIYDFPVVLPADMVYFARTASLIEGLGIRYDERFNVLAVVAPIALGMRREILASIGQLSPTTGIPAQTVADLVRAAGGVFTRAARELSTLAIEAMASIQTPHDRRSGQSSSTSSRHATAGAVRASETDEAAGSGVLRT